MRKRLIGSLRPSVNHQWPDCLLRWRALRASMFSTSTKSREGHGGIDVALRHMEAHAFCNQRRADHQQEGKRQHDDGRVLLDEVCQRGFAASSMTATAAMTAITMIGRCGVMPTA